jgi:transcriptional regulator with XRE-family HTH domain
MNLKIQHHVGRRIRDIRKQHRFTQAEFAARLHSLHAPITRNVVANWEIGRSEVPANYIPVLAYALHAEVVDILPGLTTRDLRAGQIMPSLGSPRRQRQQT